ncbi:serine hydrolase [Lysobacter sp. A3-1-A15]|uniref:serine hydrolase n=1 Tax=Novilysobacter viscosus TaxID=3098602 RepID=UPI002ED942B7
MTDSELAARVAQRLHGDRTGACFAVAVVGTDVARSFTCADPDAAPRIDGSSAFEIGSVSKTLTATLLADLVERGEADLDDPLAEYLPAGSEVPMFEGQPILLRHLVTHTSGLPALPPGGLVNDASDPYAALTPQALLAVLPQVSLDRAPGTRFEYSNFASMLLSYAVARRAGKGFDALLSERILQPLSMDGVYLSAPPDGVRPAVGHTPDAQPTGAWNFHPDLAGVGGVRATLQDMVHYVQAHLGQRPSSLDAALARSRQPVDTASAQPMAMNWMLAPLEGHTVHVHEGGTGGFSSFVAFDASRKRGVVVLSDTALTSTGGLGSLGLHLLDERVPLGAPRKASQAPGELLDALAGTWQLQGGPRLEIRRKGDALEMQAAGQPAFELGHDDAGDFYPLAFDALLRPQRGADGAYRFSWHQGGGVMQARRVPAGETAGATPTSASASASGLAAQDLQAYAGDYPLMPSMTLAIRVQGDTLFAQATGQGAFALAPVSADVFEAARHGIEIRFQRGDDGAVIALALHQGGQILRGARR